MSETETKEIAKTTNTLLVRLGAKYHIDPAKLTNTLKATAFRQQSGEVTTEQMMALLIVADQYGLNPWTREIYAFPDKNGGIVPVVGVDGWSRIINSHEQFDGATFAQSDEIVSIDKDAKPCPEWIEVVIHRKDRQHAMVIREYLDECYRPAFEKNGKVTKGPWQTHTKRMLRHKTLIQGGRSALSLVGIYDPDEAERIVEAMGDVVATQPAGTSRKPETQAPVRIGVPAGEAVIEPGKIVTDDLLQQVAADTDAELVAMAVDQSAQFGPDEMKGVREALADCGVTEADLLKHFDVAAVGAFDVAMFDNVMDWILDPTQHPTK